MKNSFLALILISSSSTSALVRVLSNTFTSGQNIGGSQYQPASNPFINPFFGGYGTGAESYGSQAPQVPQIPQGGNGGQLYGPQQGFGGWGRMYNPFGDEANQN